MRDIRSGHYRFFILLFGLQMKRGAGARRLSLMKEGSQISSESYKWSEGGGVSGLKGLGKRHTVLLRWEHEAQTFLLHEERIYKALAIFTFSLIEICLSLKRLYQCSIYKMLSADMILP